MPTAECPSCAKRLRVADDLAGKRVRCPGCGKPVPVPVGVAKAAPAPPPAEPDVDSDPSGKATVSSGFFHDHTLSPESPAPPPKKLVEFLAPAQTDGELGRLGPYRVLKVLGHGGMGVVFLAEDAKLKRKVALKAMLPSVAENENARRFVREAQAMAQVKHKHVASIYQVDEDRGVPYLAMEFLIGEPLDALLKRQPILPIAEVLRIGREIAEGLAAAHKRGLIHRDIKPANVWLEEDEDAGSGRPGSVKILDFGLARSDEGESHLTQSGMIVGTPAYMAPEQGRGGDVDARCDLFSLGVVLYRMATGAMPFKGKDTVSTLMAVAMDAPPPPQLVNLDVPAGLSDLILKLLEKDPARRPQTAREVAGQLATLDRGAMQTQIVPIPQATAIRPALPERTVEREPFAPSTTEKAKASGRRPRWSIFAALVGLALVGGVWFAWQTVVRVETTEGSLVVAVNDPAIEVAIKMGGIEIEHKSKNRTFTLRPGNGQITFHDSDGVQLETREFKIVSGDKTLVEAHFETRAKIAAKPPEPTPPIKSGPLQPGPTEGVLPGPIARPAKLPGIGRWQMETAGNRYSHNTVAWSRDGKWIAVGAGGQDRIRIYDAATAQLSHFIMLPYGAHRFALSRDGTLIAAGLQDGTLRVWNVDGTPGLVAQAHARPVYCVAWHPDGRLATGSDPGDNDPGVKIWSADGKHLADLKGHEKFVACVAWSPDGKLLASSSLDKTVRIWTADGKAGSVLPTGSSDYGRYLAWSPDSKLLVSATYDRCLNMWDRDGKLVFEGKAAQTVSGLEWHPGGNEFALADAAGVSFFDRVGTSTKRLRAESYPATSASFAPDGTKVAIASYAANLEIRGMDDKQLAKFLKVETQTSKSVATSPDGREMIVGGFSPFLRVLDWNGKLASGIPVEGRPSHTYMSLTWGKDRDRWLVQCYRTSALIADREGKALVYLAGDAASPRCVCWSPDQSQIATVGEDKKIRLWTADGKPARVFDTPHEKEATQIAWSPDGKWLATIAGNVMHLWSRSGKLRWKRDGKFNYGRINWLADSAGIVALGSEGSSGVERISLDGSRTSLIDSFGYEDRVGAFLARDGNRVARGQLNTVRLSSFDGKLSGVLTGHTQWVTGADWSADGSRLATTSDDGTVRAWDVATKQCLWTAIFLDDGKAAIYDAAGNLLDGDPAAIERELVYLVETPTGRLDVLRPSEFAKRIAARP